MRRALRHARWSLAGVCVGLVCGGVATAADFSTGGSFLPLGHGARSHGLGGAGATRVRDDGAIYWNPANLAWLESQTSLTLMAADILPGVNDGYHTLSFARGFGDHLGAPDQRLRPSRWGYGLFLSNLGFEFASGTQWSENVLQVGIAFAFNNFTSAGIALKALRLSNDFESADASGGGFDAALSVLIYENLSLALVVKDGWTRLRWDTDKWETLEPSLTLGLEQRPSLAWGAAVDVTWRQRGLNRAALGLEYVFREALALRGGGTLLTPGETRAFPSLGVGVRWSSLRLDYGISFDDEDSLGLGHRVSLHGAF